MKKWEAKIKSLVVKRWETKIQVFFFLNKATQRKNKNFGVKHEDGFGMWRMIETKSFRIFSIPFSRLLIIQVAWIFWMGLLEGSLLI